MNILEATLEGDGCRMEVPFGCVVISERLFPFGALEAGVEGVMVLCSLFAAFLKPLIRVESFFFFCFYFNKALLMKKKPKKKYKQR